MYSHLALSENGFLFDSQSGKTFNLVTEATYWNTFQDTEQQRASVTAHEATEELTLLLVFPTES